MRVPVLLPRSDAETPAVVVPVKTDAELEAIRISGAGRTILVIDDDPEAQDIVERFLRKDGFEVATASSGEEGLRIAHKLKPAAITLDVMMPDMDGWSVLRALKADPVLKDIPVLMLTMVDDKSKGYALGATDYLTKPVDREQLNNALSKYYTPGESCSVLLVEDDQPTREVMARTLEKSNWTVSEAGNGREALDQLAQQKPRLILLDLMMPVMDGFDFLLELRAKPEWLEIPVIVLTAKDLTDEDRRVLRGRVEQIVEKGACAHDQVVSLIHKALDPAPAIQ
jgi:CheY-like chemotaxis protein